MQQQGGFFYWLKIMMILAIIGVGFFCGQKILADQNIIISEVQITGGAGKTENDFIEIYNPNNFAVNLKGYRLVKRTKTGITDTNIKSWATDIFIPANDYYLWANSGYINISTTPNATTTATISDDNGIAIRFGAVDTGTIIDSVAWGNAQNIFIEGSVFLTNPGANQSLERKFNLDSDNNNADFFIQANPNPQNSSTVVILPPPEQPPENDTTASTSDQISDQTSSIPISSGSVNAPIIKNSFGDVVINEIVSDPGDNEVEWIELFNTKDKEINLSDWWIEDGSKTKTSLSGSLGINGVDRYKIIEKPAGVLNNDGDLIVLYDDGGKIIDQVAYGNWNDGNLEDNAPAVHNPSSVARKYDGYNTYNNFNDFASTIKYTKNASNIIQIEDEVSAEAKAKFDFSNDIYISEILPDPIGDDTKLEFIEIYNASSRQVNLTGWSLSNEDNKKINFEKIATSTIIKSGEYLVFFRPRTKIVLHNDQGQIKLFQPLTDKPFMVVDYKNVKEGWSYNMVDYKIKGEWSWSETPTPETANLIKTVNHAPDVNFSFKSPTLINTPIIFDSSDTADADSDELKYVWDFGDGFKNNLANPQHAYLKAGIYKVKLAVSDGKETTEKEKSVTIVASVSEIALLPEAPNNDRLIINEIFSNPKGADTGEEWIELKNQSQVEFNLKNWRVENSNGKYIFKDSLIIEPDNFYVLNNQVSKLALKNTADTLKIYNNLNILVDTVNYEKAVQGESYARGENGNWFWTTEITPGEENSIKVSNSEASIEYKVSAIGQDINGFIETTLEKVREMEVGSLVKVNGTVAVEPGILGAQIFYIVGSPGIQIYNYKKDFPTLKVGDYIEVSGELTQAQNELRIKTKDKNAIKINDHKSPPIALALSCDMVSEENVGQLIILTGKITDKKSNTIYLDDGSDEILVYIKTNTGIKTKALTVGQTATVTGILSETGTGLRLLPRYQGDITTVDAASELMPQVLGEVALAEEWDLAKRDKKLELFKYLIILAGGVIILLGVLLVRAKRKNN